MTTYVTDKALEGYLAEPAEACPYLATSIFGDAWQIGRWLKQRGDILPNQVVKSRGDTYRVDTIKVQVWWKRGNVKIERIG